MEEKLAKALEDLLVQFPELANTSISFINNQNIVQNNVIANCEALEEPDIIAGTSAKTEIRKSGIQGYGVFAKEPIYKDELIEENRLLELGLRSNLLTDPVLKNYVWQGPKCDCLLCKTYGPKQYFAFGLPCLSNHSDAPNTRQEINYTKCISKVWAARDIAIDEEIFVSYGKKYWLIRDFWNHVHKTDGIAKFHQANIAPNINNKP